MEKQELANLESRIQETKKNLSQLADHAELQEFLAIIHRPGWTTVAEAAFVSGIVDSIASHTQVLLNLKGVLLAGARAVSTK
jgi:hypothetical protein